MTERLGVTALEEDWDAAGGTRAVAPLMAGIALSESSGTPGAVQQGQPYSTTGWGLWQITPGDSESSIASNTQLLTPLENARAAVAKFDSAEQAGGTGLSPWTTDPTWKAWKAAGAPADPSTATVEGYVSSWDKTQTSVSGFFSGLGDVASGGFDLLTLATGGAAGRSATAAGNSALTSLTGIGSAEKSFSSFLSKAILVVAGAALVLIGGYRAANPKSKAPDLGDLSDLAKVPA